MLLCSNSIEPSSVVELGVVIGKKARDISASQADMFVAGYSTSF
jgi:hypothetical protein